MVEHYAHQHAPQKELPDGEGWSKRLPGYDLPALLRDAQRYRYVRDCAYGAETIDGYRIIYEEPMPDPMLPDSAENMDHAIDAAMR